jgi:NAD(P)-dependent dehydrogenase (short-subunit alcohol dehydrogenase family)
VTRTDPSPGPDYAALLRLDGRRYLVAGAGQGIGRQTAHALAGAGAHVICVDREGELADEVAAEVGGTGVPADVTRRDDVERLVARAGALDGVVDIIGMARFKPLAQFSDEDWAWQFDIVLRHVFLLAQVAAPAIGTGGAGSMVFVSSAAALTGAPMTSAYAAAKAGVTSLVRSLAVELAERRIRVNCVVPGMTATPRMEAAMDEATRRAFAENSLTGRIGTAADIAASILFLTSDLARQVNGQALVVDGGVSVKLPYPELGPTTRRAA